KGAYLAFRARAGLGFLGILLVGGAVVEILFGGAWGGPGFAAHPLLEGVAAAALVGVGLFGVPLGLRIVWFTRPLPEGEVKDALQAFSREVGFRFREIRLWETGGVGVLNAAVAGLYSGLRTVFLTRSLLEHLKVQEVLSVFAHEVGHVKGRHAWVTLGLAVGWGGFILGIDGGALDGVGGPWALVAQGAVTLVFGGMYVCLSRRLESAADLYAVDAMGDVEGVAETLLRVAMLNGDIRSLQSITHASVASRVAFLRQVVSNPAERARFQRGLRIWVAASAASMVAGIGVAAPRFF
ncbi:MAG: M48 family metalloprotease, partial [Planctomycetota bacterium]